MIGLMIINLGKSGWDPQSMIRDVKRVLSHFQVSRRISGSACIRCTSSTARIPFACDRPFTTSSLRTILTCRWPIRRCQRFKYSKIHVISIVPPLHLSTSSLITWPFDSTVKYIKRTILEQKIIQNYSWLTHQLICCASLFHALQTKDPFAHLSPSFG